MLCPRPVGIRDDFFDSRSQRTSAYDAAGAFRPSLLLLVLGDFDVLNLVEILIL